MAEEQGRQGCQGRQVPPWRPWHPCPSILALLTASESKGGRSLPRDVNFSRSTGELLGNCLYPGSAAVPAALRPEFTRVWMVREAPRIVRVGGRDGRAPRTAR